MKVSVLLLVDQLLIAFFYIAVLQLVISSIIETLKQHFKWNKTWETKNQQQKFISYIITFQTFI